MAFIKNIRVIASNKSKSRIDEDESSNFREILTFKNPKKNYELVLHSPEELRMAYYGWVPRLLYKGYDITKEHPFFAKIDNELLSEDEYSSDDDFEGFLINPREYQPWDSYGENLFVALDKDSKHKIVIYNISDKSITARMNIVRIISVQGSKEIPRFILLSSENFLLTDNLGAPISKIPYKVPKDGDPYVRWLKDGRTFFVLGNDPKETANQIVFFEGDGAKKMESIPIDPLEIFPYDQNKYSKIRRDKYSLQIEVDHFSIGASLDQWNIIGFDEERNVLKLQIYRPIGDIFKSKEKYVTYACEVEEKLVEVTIEAP